VALIVPRGPTAIFSAVVSELPAESVTWTASVGEPIAANVSVRVARVPMSLPRASSGSPSACPGYR
jgi:hypothetical protein